ncbi:hypothetical protein EST38_g6068 [Candolleomyces aberdarensis]|uniref:Uncharacterized protein n=1 Tax=Candolleomyces aberdarensis TaxID=2316362 RepID=A0A4Q2DIZ2_9AGAR|nr:hypothetical protein EST38_g6068 [Candolleomyces aberdarensis]
MNSKVKGKVLKELRELKLDLMPSWAPPANTGDGYEGDWAEPPLVSIPFTIDCFSNAPNLRDVELSLHFALNGNDQRPIKIDLPWAQLESFKCTSFRDDGAYGSLLQACNEESSMTPSRLQVLDLSVNRLSPIPTLSFTSTTLHTLHLRLGLNPDVFYSHLDTLTLPSLQDLEIRGPFGMVGIDDDNNDNLYITVRQLILRSQCPLKKLALDMGWSLGDDPDQQWEGLSRILSLSPHLQELDVAISHGQESSRTLQGLTVGEGVSYLCDAPLPDLQILTFRLVSLPSPGGGSGQQSHTGSDLTIMTTIEEEGEEGQAEEEEGEEEQEEAGEEYEEAGEDQEEEPALDAWGAMDMAQIFDLSSFEQLIRSRTRSVACLPPRLVEVRLVLPECPSITGRLLQRIQLACDFKVEQAQLADDLDKDSELYGAASYHWKAYEQVNEVMLLRRQSIAYGPQIVETVNKDGDGDDDEPSAFAVKTYSAWAWQ